MKKVLNFRLAPFAFIALILTIILVCYTSYIWGLVLLGVALTITISSYIIGKYRKYFPRLLAIFVIISLGVLSTSLCVLDVESNKNIDNVYVTGRITTLSEYNTGGVISDNTFVIDNVSYRNADMYGKIDDRVMVTVNLEQPLTYSVGETVTIFGSLVANNVVFNEPYSISNYSKNISYTIVTENITVKQTLTLTLVDTIKIKADKILSKMPFESGAVMYSMVFGDDSKIDYFDLVSYRKIGIAHLFAVSGLHVGVLASAISYLVKKLKGNKYIDYFATIMVTLFYAFITGFGVSVMRAFIMLVVYKTGRLYGLRRCGLSSLCISGVIILLASPFMLFSISFELSMLAILGIVFFYKPISKLLRFLPKSVGNYLAMTIAVNITIVPVMLSAFGSVSLIFLLANLFIVPIATFLFPFMLALLSISLIIPYSYVLLIPIGFVFALISFISNFLASVPFLMIDISFSVIGVVVYLITISLLSPYFMIDKKIKKVASLIMIVAFSSVVVVSSYHLIDAGVKINVVTNTKDADYVMLTDGSINYLVINGEITEYYIDNLHYYMANNQVSKIDVLVKAYFTKSDSKNLDKLTAVTRANYVVTNTENSHYEAIYKLDLLFHDNIHSIVNKDKYTLSIVNENTILLNAKGINVIFSNVSTIYPSINIPNYIKVDILFANGDYDSIRDIAPTYFVSNYGVSNKIVYSINSHFTFSLKNGRIRVR